MSGQFSFLCPKLELSHHNGILRLAQNNPETSCSIFHFLLNSNVILAPWKLYILGDGPEVGSINFITTSIYRPHQQSSHHPKTNGANDIFHSLMDSLPSRNRRNSAPNQYPTGLKRSGAIRRPTNPLFFTQESNERLVMRKRSNTMPTERRDKKEAQAREGISTPDQSISYLKQVRHLKPSAFKPERLTSTPRQSNTSATTKT